MSEKSASCKAAVIGKGDSSPYEMFEIRELTGDGAFLAGPILLEPGESLTLALSFENGTQIEVAATVASAERNGSSGVRVVFNDKDKVKPLL